MTTPKATRTPGHDAYLEDCRRRPTYDDGAMRDTWEQISGIARESWERNPTPRTYADRTISTAPTVIEHWNHAGECIRLDLEDVWSAEFARWDALVPTDTASAIASAVVKELRKLGN